MNYTTKDISDIIEGEIEGNDKESIFSLSKIEDGFVGSISFLANLKYESYLYKTKSSVVIVNKDFKPSSKNHPTLIKVDDAYQSFCKLLELFSDSTTNKKGIEKGAQIHSSVKIKEDNYIGSFCYIDENAIIGNNVKIHPNSFIGKNTKIGNNTTLHSGVKIMSNCIIGDDCIIHSGTVIGSDGFGFSPNAENNYNKIEHIGNVVIGNRVEIGANTTIDKATLGSTKIKDGVKLDNLIQIAHNVEIGENTVIAAQTGIAGSTKIGKNCMIGGQVGIVGHLEIADEVKIAAQSGIASNIKEKGSIVQGSPAYKIGEYKRSYVFFKKLPELYLAINKLQKKVDSLLQK
jgi:UDP-3-O-[3-hydroxymyristoyl] glucosamine N-acyltransferase